MSAGTPYDDELTAAGLDPAAVLAQVRAALAEDLPAGDVTSEATISADALGTGVFAARDERRRTRVGDRVGPRPQLGRQHGRDATREDEPLEQ